MRALREVSARKYPNEIRYANTFFTEIPPDNANIALSLITLSLFLSVFMILLIYRLIRHIFVPECLALYIIEKS